MTGKIKTLGNTYSFEEIKRGDWDTEESAYLKEALSFCQDWLSGQNLFELHTSGSTGAPKPIQVERDKMEKSAQMTGEFLKLENQPKLLCCLNTAMIAGKMMLVRGMVWESELHIVSPSSLFPARLPHTDYDLVAMVPMQVEKALRFKERGRVLGNTKNFLIGGAPSSERLREELRSWSGNFFQTFGMTETVSHIALADLKSKGPLIYKTLPGVDIDADASGRLYVKSPTGIQSGFLTNDIVELTGKNEFIWKGRFDFVINSGGYKIFVEELEREIEPVWQQYLPVNRFIITKASDELLGEKVILIFEGKLSTQDLSKCMAALKSKLHPYKYPKEVLQVDEFCTTPSGKINRVKTTEKLKL
ncbi:AMP-binding protein [Pleomorphovibrio marinus]|uniref:AMP-binding protein n=1 Tax=Pleomorphovibrio marinus TaxID=2164132 RepID=UPI000E0C38AF|nr:AMP-binding protein [Pleomorphovibrio marinus]